MFDVNEAIIRWREGLAQGEACGKSDLEELECHLREQIEELSRSGLSAEEAFWIAVHRIGETGSLTREFAKINRGTVEKWVSRVGQ